MKKMISLAIAAALTSGAVNAAPSIYGAINTGVNSQSSSSTDTMALGSYSSKVGVKGEEQINEGLAGIYKVEMGLDVSGDSSTITTYNTIVGLRGKAGTVYVGRNDTPYKQAGSSDIFANTAADSQHSTSGVIGRSGWDKRENNIIGYVSPKIKGVVISAATSLDESVNDSNFKTTSMAATYTSDAFKAAAAYEINHNGTSDNTSAFKMTATVNEGNYTYGGTYESADRNGTEDVVALMGSLTYNLNEDNKILAQYGTIDTPINDDLKSRLTVGLSHKLASKTSIYGAWNNDDMGTLGDVSTITAGVSHSF